MNEQLKDRPTMANLNAKNGAEQTACAPCYNLEIYDTLTAKLSQAQEANE